MEYNVHGNGFLQLQVSSDERIHVWDDRIPRQDVPSLYHDHRFGFRSEILRGCLINVVLDLVPNAEGEFRMWTPKSEDTPNIDCKLVCVGGRYSVFLRTVNTYLPGDVYNMEPCVFHHTIAIGTTVTRMQITRRIETWHPRVLCHNNLTPDNSFDRLRAMSHGAVRNLLADLELDNV